MSMPKQRGRDFLGECKYCDSEKIEYDTIEMDGEQQWQKVTCNNCNKKFTIYSEVEWFILENDEDDEDFWEG